MRRNILFYKYLNLIETETEAISCRFEGVLEVIYQPSMVHPNRLIVKTCTDLPLTLE